MDMIEWWIDYEPWPGPEAGMEIGATRVEWIELAKAVNDLGLVVGESVRAFISKMAGVADAFTDVGEAAGNYKPLLPPPHEPPPPGMKPRHVGPRPKNTFGRGGKRNF